MSVTHTHKQQESNIYYNFVSTHQIPNKNHANFKIINSTFFKSTKPNCLHTGGTSAGLCTQ